MLSRARRNIFSQTYRAASLASIVLFLVSVSASASPGRSNVVCREELSQAHRQQLSTKLRRITGLPDLKFDDDGILREGKAHPVGGSASARALIANAIHGSKVVVIEEARNRSEVAFGRVIPGKWKSNAASAPPVFVVQIDFLDFEQLVGDDRALAAFNLGWGFLHELDHAVSDSPDAMSLGESGECEAHINQMRRECDLPERADYFSTLLPLASAGTFKTRLVRLPFEQLQPAANKKKRYWVIWDADVVGGLEANQLASLR